MAESFFNKKLVCVKEMMQTASNNGYSEPIVLFLVATKMPLQADSLGSR